MVEYAELYKVNGVWMCRYTSAQAKARMITIMGTAEIPTAFTAAASYEEVRTALNAIPANRHTCFMEAGR